MMEAVSRAPSRLPTLSSQSLISLGSSLLPLLGVPSRTYCPSVCSMSPLLAVPLPLAKELQHQAHQFPLEAHSLPTGQHGWSNLEFILLLFLAPTFEVTHWKITLNKLLNSLKIWL